MIIDKLNRPLKDLRVSVIDRCNFRCTYCMPEESFQNYQFLHKDEWLMFDEITRLVRIFTSLGVRKVRLTGGEPLLRPNLEELVSQIGAISALDDLALTTNGALLYQYAEILRQKGLRRVTISVDSLDPNVNRQMSGGRADINVILEGIEEAQRVGFESVKVNVVVQKGVNDHTLVDLVRHFRRRAISVRFIEFMDVGTLNEWDYRYVMPSQQVVELIHREFPVEPIAQPRGADVAARYRFQDGQGEMGVISSVTEPFCGACSRARLSADGKLYTCLFAAKGTDLRSPLRAGASDDEIRRIIEGVWRSRTDRYSEERFALRGDGKSSSKIEMFAIGG